VPSLDTYRFRIEPAILELARYIANGKIRSLLGFWGIRDKRIFISYLLHIQVGLESGIGYIDSAWHNLGSSVEFRRGWNHEADLSDSS
jgi:hypothetical protein